MGLLPKATLLVSTATSLFDPTSISSRRTGPEASTLLLPLLAPGLER
jgi:hypothetical protein